MDLDSAQVFKLVEICVSCHAVIAVAFEVLVFVMAGTETMPRTRMYFVERVVTL